MAESFRFARLGPGDVAHFRALNAVFAEAFDDAASYGAAPPDDAYLAALLTGLIQSLGTAWGLFRHYWVVVKLVLNLFATGALLVHTQPIGIVASAAARGAIADPMLHSTKVQLIVVAAAALFVLLVATVLSEYKPRGLTPYGWRKQQG